MKKIVYILAAISVCACMLLTACSSSNSGGGSGNNSGGGVNLGGSSNNGSSNNNNNNNDSDDDDDDIDDDSGSEVEYFCGSMEDGVFSSSFLGIGADFSGEEWIWLTRDELSSYNGGAATDEELKRKAEAGNSVYEMLAGKETGSNVNVVVQKMGIGSVILEVTEEEYVDMTVDSLAETLVGVIDNAVAEKINVSFAGANHYGIDVVGQSYGMDVYERIICISKGNYMGLVTITSMSNEEREEFTEIFYKL